MNKEVKSNIGFIFEQMARGVPSADILSQIEEKRRRRAEGSEAFEKGRHSERVARNAISKIPIVASAIITPKDGYEDTNSVDISVRLRKTPYVEHVVVQVKSNQRHIGEAKRILRKRTGLTRGQFDEWLMTNKLIFVNGQMSHGEIQEQFMDQLNKIKEFHAASQKPRKYHSTHD